MQGLFLINGDASHRASRMSISTPPSLKLVVCPHFSRYPFPRCHAPTKKSISIALPILQQALLFQKAAGSVGKGVRQLCEFLAGRCFNPAEPDTPIGAIDIHPIE